MSREAIDDLISQVWLHPDDDQLRHVLADALIAIGDPRGELIQLQLQPASDHELRAMRLVQQHGLTWLGALRNAVIPLAYERGFLASCIVVDATDVLDASEWSTVHTIEFTDADTADPVSFALSPAMRSLRRVINVPPRMLWRMITHTPDLVAPLDISTRHDDSLVKILELAPDVAFKLAVFGVRESVRATYYRIAASHRRMKLSLPLE